MPTTFSNDVWGLVKSKAFKLNALDFQPPEGVVVSLLSFKSWLQDKWISACRKAYERGQSEVGNKVEGIRFPSSKTRM